MGIKVMMISYFFVAYEECKSKLRSTGIQSRVVKLVE